MCTSVPPRANYSMNVNLNMKTMKNLNVLYNSKKLHKINLNQLILNHHSVYDLNFDETTLYVYYNKHIYGISINEEPIVIRLRNSGKTVVSIAYCNLNQQIICAMQNPNDESGILKSYSLYTGQSKKCYNIFNGGIRCMKFDPQNSILIVISKFNEIYILYSYDHFNNNTISSPIRLIPLEDTVIGNKSIEKENSTDQEFSCIDWKFDSSAFVIYYFSKAESVRKYKIFNKTGSLQYISEDLHGTHGTLTWRTLDDVLAIYENLNSNHIVSFYTTKGEKWEELPVAVNNSNIMVKQISWSSDSEILAVLFENTDTNEHFIQLWTETKNRWYLKQTMTFLKRNPVLYMTWCKRGDDSKKKIFILTANEYRVYTFTWENNHSIENDISDKSVVGVIDDKNIHLACFQKASLKLPLFQHNLAVGEPVFAIIFPQFISRKYNSKSFFCVLKDLQFLLYTYDDNLYKQHKKFTLSWEDTKVKKYSSYLFGHYLWINDDTILCSATSEDSLLLTLNVNTKTESVIIKQSVPVYAGIKHIIKSAVFPNKIYIFTILKEIYAYNIDDESMEFYLETFEFCKQLQIVNISGKDTLIYISQSNALYINNLKTHEKITSFYVRSDYILLTRSLVMLYIPANDQGLTQLLTSNLSIKLWEHWNGVSIKSLKIQRISKDATLVTSVSRDGRSVLETPRGILTYINDLS